MTEYRRFRHPGATWFFTVNLAERREQRLLTDRIDVLRSAFVHVKANHPFTVDAIVVLPDHLHCILTGFRFFNPLGLNQKPFFPQH